VLFAGRLAFAGIGPAVGDTNGLALYVTEMRLQGFPCVFHRGDDRPARLVQAVALPKFAHRRSLRPCQFRVSSRGAAGRLLWVVCSKAITTPDVSFIPCDAVFTSQSGNSPDRHSYSSTSHARMRISLPPRRKLGKSPEAMRLRTWLSEHSHRSASIA